jgi:hypothetical protein
MSPKFQPGASFMTHRTLLAFTAVCLLAASRQALAAPLKTCDLITVQTASSAFGATLRAGREESLAMGAHRCVFEQEDPASPGTLAFTVSDANTLAAAMHSDVAGLTRLLKQREIGQTSETIPSLGEWNSYVWNGLTDYTLTVVYHGKVLFLVASGTKKANPRAVLVQTMRQTMRKL